MPELPEVEITARLIGEAAAGARVGIILSGGNVDVTRLPFAA